MEGDVLINMYVFCKKQTNTHFEWNAETKKRQHDIKLELHFWFN